MVYFEFFNVKKFKILHCFTLFYTVLHRFTPFYTVLHCFTLYYNAEIEIGGKFSA